jgi:prepilin peptidase CpaA
MSRFLELFPLLVLLAIAAIGDWRERRIRNWLTLCIACTGLMHGISAPGASLGVSLLGLAVGFALMLPQFVLGALGGGDVKLMAGIGAWMGAVGVLEVFLGASVIGLAIVLVQCAAKGRLTILFGNTLALLTNFMMIEELGLDRVTATGQSCRSVDQPLPYAVSVLLAVVLLVVPH